MVIFVSLLYLLLLYKPARYNPLDIIYDGQVSKYLTHELLPQLHNGAQRGEPFDLVVTQKGINDAIARAKWPKRYSGIIFSAPEVLFLPDTIVLMGTTVLKRVQVVITIELNPSLNERGLLNLHMAKIKAGVMNITPLVKVVAGRMYTDRLAIVDVDPGDLRAQIAASLFNDEPFDPIFEIKDIFDGEERKVRVEKITLMPEKLTVRLAPLPTKAPALTCRQQYRYCVVPDHRAKGNVVKLSKFVPSYDKTPHGDSRVRTRNNPFSASQKCCFIGHLQTGNNLFSCKSYPSQRARVKN